MARVFGVFRRTLRNEGDAISKSRYTDAQTIQVLKAVEGGRLVNEVCREYGISDATCYNWKAQYGGMEASGRKRLKKPEDENRRLKHMYPGLTLDHRILKDVIEKSCKAGGPTLTRGIRRGSPRGEPETGLSGGWNQ